MLEEKTNKQTNLKVLPKALIEPTEDSEKQMS